MLGSQWSVQCSTGSVIVTLRTWTRCSSLSPESASLVSAAEQGSVTTQCNLGLRCFCELLRRPD